MINRRMAVGSLTVGLSALACSSSLYLRKAWAADKIVLGLDWQPLGRHAGFFVAKAKGYYEKAGMDVNIERGYGASDSVKRLAAGESTFAFGDVGSLALACAQGIQEKAIAMIYARGPYVVWTRKDAKINAPKDLEGKRIGSPAGSSVRQLFPAIASVTGFDATKVKWITVDAAGLYPLLFSDGADAVVDYEVGWPTISKRAKEAKIAIGSLKFADYGFDIYSNAILARDDTLSSNPVLVKRFIKASLEGMRSAFADPSGAGQIMHKQFPLLDADTAAQEVEIVRSLAESGGTEKHDLGYMSLEKMKLTRDVVFKSNDVKVDVPVDKLFTNDFLPS